MWMAYVVLILNILEATVKDFTLGHTFNGITGLILIVTIPVTPHKWGVETESRLNDILFDLPILWTILYTTWNICFISGEKPEYTAHVICILMVPLVYSVILRRPDLWYSARAYTLAISLYIRATYDVITPSMNIVHLADANMTQNFGLLNLTFGLIFLVWTFRKGHKKMT